MMVFFWDCDINEFEKFLERGDLRIGFWRECRISLEKEKGKGFFKLG